MKKEKTKIIKPKKEGKNTNFNLILSCLSLVLGIILLTSSTGAVILVCYVIGGIIGLFGIYHLIHYFKLKKDLKIEYSQKLIIGITSIAIGIIVIILASVLEACLRFIIGFSLIYNGFKKAITAINNREAIILFLGILFIAMGIYTILAENIVFQIVGVLLIISSIIDLLNYFLKEKK